MDVVRRFLPASSPLSHKLLRMLALVCMIGGLLSFSAHAQMTVGHITGTVTDPSGAVLAGAQVTLTNEGTSVPQRTVTTSTGSYTFEQVIAGTYSLRVDAPGFTAQATHGIAVHVQETVTQNYKLAVGNVTTQVTVTEATPLLQAQEASTGQEVDEQLVNDLPLVGRDWTTLAHIAPGVTTVNGGSQSGMTFSSNGVNSVQNDMRLNGVDDNMEFYGGMGGISIESSTSIIPPPDGLQEFKLQESNYSAEFGHSTGSVMDAVIKSGSNTYNGDLWEYVRNTDFNANNWFSNGFNGSHTPRPAYHENQYGGTVGGPMRLPFHQGGVKNTFWFLDAQQISISAPNFYTDSVPTCGVLGAANVGACSTTSMLGSGFKNMQDMLTVGGTNTDSEGRIFPAGTIMDPATTRTVAGGGTLDPITGYTNSGTNAITVRDPIGTHWSQNNGANLAGITNFTSTGSGNQAQYLNLIPGTGAGNRIDSNAVSLLSLYPIPTTLQNATTGNKFTSNLYLTRNYKITVDQYDFRVDTSLNANNLIWGVFDQFNALQNTQGALPGYAEGANYGAGSNWSPHWAMAASFTHIFNPTTTNVMHFGYESDSDYNTPPYGNTSGVAASFGMAGLENNGTATGPGLGGLPNFSISKLPGLGVSGYNPFTHIVKAWELEEILTKIHGNHTINVGYQLTDISAWMRQPTAGAGQITYNGAFSDITGNDTGYTSMADMLLTPNQGYSYGTNPGVTGTPYDVGGAASIVLSTANFIGSQRWYNAGFFQDDWKITPKLTINIGARYDKYGPTLEVNDHQGNLVPAGAGNGLFGQGNGTSTNSTNDHSVDPALASGYGNFGGGGAGSNGTYFLPNKTCASTQAFTGFVNELTADGINIQCTSNRGVMGVDKLDFAPRVGFAYQYRPDIVVRGGFGITYGSLGNIGAAPYVLGNNYPFVYSAQQSANGSSTIPIQVAGLTPQPTSGSTLTPTIENAFTSTNISSPANASIKGIQVAGMGTGDNYQTPYMESYNLTVQKQLGSHDSVQLAYVGDIGQHLDSRGTNNQPSIFLPSGTGQAAYSPFPDLALESAWLSTNGHSMYNSMQAVYNHEVSLGLNLTANYTWSKCMTDAADISERLPPRAQFLPGFGIASEYSTCIDNANQTFHASGSYDLPFGTGKQFLSSASHAENLIIGGWALNGIFAYQTGQPFTIPSANNVPSGMSADANIVGNQYEGAKTPSAWLNKNAFQTPPLITSVGETDLGFAPLGPKQMQSVGPTFFNIDSSIFKNFAIKGDSTYLQFRAEQFNLANHGQFNNPSSQLNYKSNGFAALSSVRNANRIMQLSLKLYY
jgi:hypothetical protein